MGRCAISAINVSVEEVGFLLSHFSISPAYRASKKGSILSFSAGISQYPSMLAQKYATSYERYQVDVVYRRSGVLLAAQTP
ncbi:hypothetical protein PGT21_032500 [Puccinia graminis f. sp. tritici]|uniref:Uncharacterized protein n=1 Tax=Puccinia graminis f. sp. tritici TaxID=56615 RepID=A0A5B0LZJ9_PUCGR|nr:hypothetical protein PGT21_032500 [Puccinia graminis f. sp. tritici]